MAAGNVVVASNGGWSLDATSTIDGDVLYRVGNPSGNITGDKILMNTNIAYPDVTTPAGAYYAGAVNYTSGTFNVAGDYSVTACTVSGTFTINLTADTTMYCSSNVAFGGNCQVITNGFKFTIYMTGATGTIAMTNNLPVSVVIYGPNATMTVNAPGKITGSFLCKTLNMTGGTIEYTSALPIPVLPSAGGSASVPIVMTVK